MRGIYERLARALLFGGIIAFVVYIAYAAMGNRLWPEYNPITTDISSLSADGAPNQALLAPLLALYSALFLGFNVVYVSWVFYKRRPTTLKIGAVMLLCMALISLIGYGLFPLSGEKTEMTFQNVMHLLVTVAVVFLSIAALYLIAVGYRSIPDTRRFGRVMLALATIFTVLGALNPIGMALGLDVLGLTERAAIYSLHLIIGVIGMYEGKRTFNQVTSREGRSTS